MSYSPNEPTPPTSPRPVLRLSSSAVRCWRDDERGVVAMIFALAMVPIIVMAGSAMDYHRATSADARVQAALDAATLAGAKAPTPSERAQVAGDVFRANTAAL